MNDLDHWRRVSLGFLLLLPLGCGGAHNASTTAPSQEAGANATDEPLVLQSSGAVLQSARSRAMSGDPSIAPAIAALRKDADASMRGGPYTVINKMHPIPGIDPHNYVSLARYYWPDPTKPGGLPYISRDGESNPEIEEYDTKPFHEMGSHVYTLALAGYLTGDAKYSARAALLLRTWFLNDATKMYPNLDHAQLVKGGDLGRKSGIIDSIALLDAVDAAGLLANSGEWPADDQAKFKAWFVDYANWMRQSKNGQDEGLSTNNHGCWYDAQLATYLLFTGDNAAAKQLIESAKQHRIAQQIEPTGEQPRELARTKSFSYTTYNLNAMTLLADLGNRVGVDLWHYQTPDGRSLRTTLDWVYPFATGEKEWTHPQIEPFDRPSLLIPYRRAEAAFGDSKYETVVTKLNIDLAANRDSLRFPAISQPAAVGRER